MTSLFTDLKIALRNLLRAPGFSIPVLVVLALGLGATTAMVGALRSIFFTNPPFQDSQAIHSLWWEGQNVHAPNSWPLLQEIKTRLKGASLVEGIAQRDMTFRLGDEAEIISVGRATAGFFKVFKTQALLGSLEWDPQEPQGVIITEGFWNSRFNRDPGILKRSIHLDGQSHPVLGVLPGRARYRNVQVFVPLIPSRSEAESRYMCFLTTYARLAPGTTTAQFQGELKVLSSALAHENPGGIERTRSLKCKSYIDSLRADHRTLGSILTLATLLLSAITLINVASAMLARSIANSGDTALRMALGAKGFQAIKARLWEALLLSLGGAALGLFVAQGCLVLLRSCVGKTLQAARPLTLDITLMAQMSASAFLVALLISGLPLLLLRRMRLSALMNGGGKGRVQGGSQKLRAGLVIIQVSLALTLLSSLATLGGVIWRLVQTPLGIQTDGVAVFTCSTPAQNDQEIQANGQQARTLMEHLKRIPGVNHVGSISHLPVAKFGNNYTPQIRTREVKDHEWVETRTASPEIFDAFGIRLWAGRAFTDPDMASFEPIAIISQSMARHFWPSKDPIGQEFRGSDGRWSKVIGVVSDVRNAGPGTDAHQMTSYFPFATGFETTSFVTRFEKKAWMDLKAVRNAARTAAPQWPLQRLRPASDLLDDNLEDMHTQLKLMGLAAALSLLLALIGLHSLLTYLVEQRLKEFGLRAALGASPMGLLRMVMGQGLATTLIGIAFGIAGALLTGKLLSAFLADAQPAHSLSLLVASTALFAASLLACLLPSLKAARVQPMEAMRQE